MFRISCFVFSHQAMEYLLFEGTVNLKSPQHIFCLLEDYGTDPNNIPEHPNYIYFGRWVRYRLFLYFVCLYTVQYSGNEGQSTQQVQETVPCIKRMLHPTPALNIYISLRRCGMGCRFPVYKEELLCSFLCVYPVFVTG